MDSSGVWHILAYAREFLQRLRKSGQDDFSGNFLNHEQIAKRKENLDKIMALAQKEQRITNDSVQKALGVSDATATRYLEYLVNLGKLTRMGERGQSVYYQIPQA